MPNKPLPRLKITEKWVCPLCVGDPKKESVFYGQDARQLHQKHVHKLGPGCNNKGRRGKPPKHWRHFKGKTSNDAEA